MVIMAYSLLWGNAGVRSSAVGLQGPPKTSSAVRGAEISIEGQSFEPGMDSRKAETQDPTAKGMGLHVFEQGMAGS